MKRLLITGAAGTLGTVLRHGLKDWAEILRLSDITDMGQAGPGEELITAELSNPDAVMQIVDGVDGIVHLGGQSIEGTFENIVEANLRGVYHIFEAARKHGGKRIMFASSNHAIGFHKREERLDGKAGFRPDSLYGLSKCFGENLASYYYDKFGIESVSVRIGSCFPEPIDRRMLATWLSPDDFISLIKCIFEATRVGATMVYGASDNREKWWDNSHAAFLGWTPQHSSEQFRAKIEAAHPQLDYDDPAVLYQGGGFAKAGHFED